MRMRRLQLGEARGVERVGQIGAPLPVAFGLPSSSGGNTRRMSAAVYGRRSAWCTIRTMNGLAGYFGVNRSPAVASPAQVGDVIAVEHRGDPALHGFELIERQAVASQ